MENPQTAWRVLIYGQEPEAAGLSSQLFPAGDCTLRTVTDLAAALQQLERHEADVLLVAGSASQAGLPALLQQLHAQESRPAVIVLSPATTAAARFPLSLSSSEEAILITDAEGQLLYASAAARAWLPDLPLGCRLPDWLSRQDVRQPGGLLPCAAADQPLARVLRGEEPKEAELLCRDTDRRLERLRLNAWPLRDAAGKLQGAVLTLTSLRQPPQNREQQLQVQKMEALGRLAGGIAHDFNNLLTIIGGYAELMQMSLPKDSPYRPFVEEICKASARGADLTRQLLAFSRQQPCLPQPLDLNALISAALGMLRRLVGEAIEIVADLDPSLGLVRADPCHFEQVLLNLVVNARDAMPNGGQITLRTRDLTLPAANCPAPPDCPPGRYILFQVCDTGQGMNEDVKNHLFETFFTTKKPGQGTGLGLGTVADIVRQSGGYLLVESQPGQGTTFSIYFPFCPAERRALVTDPPQRRLPRTATILLVEDEAAIRSLGACVLRQRGYQVLEAGDGLEALTLEANYPGHIDLLTVDLVLPRLGGRELAVQLRRRHPDLKVLYLCGYPESEPAHARALQDHTPLLTKPFTPTQMLATVEEVLCGVETTADQFSLETV
jgi:signal transduction histidine kinase/ActR/RegA family two-component response regulator